MDSRATDCLSLQHETREAGVSLAIDPYILAPEERRNMPAKLMEQIVRLRTAPSRSAVGGAAERRRNCVGAVTKFARIRRGGGALFGEAPKRRRPGTPWRKRRDRRR